MNKDYKIVTKKLVNLKEKYVSMYLHSHIFILQRSIASLAILGHHDKLIEDDEEIEYYIHIILLHYYPETKH